MEYILDELNALIEKSKDNIVIADGDGVILRASPSCLEIYGEQANSLIGKSVYELEASGILAPSVTVKVLKDKKESQLMQRTTTGKIVMATGFPLLNEQNEIYRVISFSHDLTEIERLKEDYNILQNRMEQYQIEIEELRDRKVSYEKVIMKSKSMRKVWELINRVADSDATVVLLGESGVGKSMLARELHEQSHRKNHPFIGVNCSTIPETLFESEMFGYEPGAFTGAQQSGKRGIIEQADKGTLFLDEITEMPMSMQAKLLKVIQEKTITRVGGTTPKTVDFRLVTATNQNLAEMVQQKAFRQDLFFRLYVLPIEIPPLRERVEDIHLLAHLYLSKFNEKYGTDKNFTPASLEAFIHYTWPGNVRELENMIERLVLTVSGNFIKLENLPFYTTDDLPVVSEAKSPPFISLKQVVKDIEKKWLLRAFRHCRTTAEMAEYLGISQPSVVRKLKEYHINSKMN